MAGLQPNDIDLIIVASSTPDFFGSFPSTACIVQQKLGITNNGAAVDVQAVCSGFVYALSTADAFIRAGVHKNVLVIGAEVFSRILDFNDRTTCVLFGDGAGAVVLTASQSPASWPPPARGRQPVGHPVHAKHLWRRDRRRSVSVHGRPGRVQAGRIGAGKSR
jgi:3-oxoacyl-(acyl-carrier-protein) synthase III